MNEAGGAADMAASELARVQSQVEAARALLIRLLQDVVVAETQLGGTQAVQLMEANEQLVLAALRSQAEAETAAGALNEAARSAERDALTQLPNRLLLLDRFVQAITAARRHSGRMAALFLDVDHFKQTNDSLGHIVGDAVLQRVAQCLTASVREADTVARFGGDEFVILLPEIAQTGDAILVANKVIAALAAVTHVGAHELHLSASIGIAVYPGDGEDAGTLIDRADTAMYRAKRLGPGQFAVHGKANAGEAVESSAPLDTSHDPALSDHELRHSQLREANQQLVLAALSAQELQAAAELSQRRQMEFMAVVADELRNPAAPIRIAAAMLGRQGAAEPLLPRLQAVVEAQAAHMSRLAGDLLDGSRAGDGQLKLERSLVDMVPLISRMVDACLPAMDKRKQCLEMHLPPGPLFVNGDAARLSQIVRNLLDNASKHSHDGGEIGVSATVKATVAGEAIVMTVSDNGIGITTQTLPHVFEPFVQDAHAIGFNGVGPGIGLTAVRAAVEAHGGSVTALSAGRGMGSQFVVTLPLARPAAAPSGKLGGSARPGPSP